MLFAKAVFFAFPDALDVGAVHVDDQNTHDEGTHKADRHIPRSQAPVVAVNEGQYRVERCHGDAAQRDHPRGEQAGQEDQEQERDEDGLDGQR